MTRLRTRRRVLQGAMRKGPARRGLMATLLASFLSFLVLATAVDAAACIAEEAGASFVEVTATQVAAPAGDRGNADRGAADPRGCTHCQCHHGGLTAPPPAPEVSRAVSAGATHPVLFVDHRPSRTPAGPERPPRA
jgi:hypothetical protein